MVGSKCRDFKNCEVSNVNAPYLEIYIYCDLVLSGYKVYWPLIRRKKRIERLWDNYSKDMSKAYTLHKPSQTKRLDFIWTLSPGDIFLLLRGAGRLIRVSMDTGSMATVQETRKAETPFKLEGPKTTGTRPALIPWAFSMQAMWCFRSRMPGKPQFYWQPQFYWHDWPCIHQRAKPLNE